MRSDFTRIHHPTLSQKCHSPILSHLSWIAYVPYEFFSTLYAVQFLFLTPWWLVVLAVSGILHSIRQLPNLEFWLSARQIGHVYRNIVVGLSLMGIGWMNG